jgi:hypothetical protein
MAERWYLDHFAGEEKVKDTFVALDARYLGEWDVPYDRVDNAFKAAKDEYWNAVPGPREKSGLLALLQPGPGELDHVLDAFAKRYTENMETITKIRKKS